MALSESELVQAVTKFIVTNFLFGNEQDAPAPTVSLLGAGLVDSTGILEIVAHLESTYGVLVEDNELVPANLDSASAIAAFVLRKQAA